MIVSAIDMLGAWAWIILGLALVGLELMAPGAFLIWLGLAAILTGLIDATFGLSWQASAIVFAVLAVIAVVLARALTRRRTDEMGEQPFLNRRGAALVGRVFTLDEPMTRGQGRIRVDDSVWRVTGPDRPAGAAVRVTAVDGATLIVEAA